MMFNQTLDADCEPTQSVLLFITYCHTCTNFFLSFASDTCPSYAGRLKLRLNVIQITTKTKNFL